jgi:membrane-bound lytic murein transglycosylase D
LALLLFSCAWALPVKPALSPEMIAAAKKTLAQSVFNHSIDPGTKTQLLLLIGDREGTQSALKRCAEYSSVIEKEFHNRGIPEEMAVLAFVESRCENKPRNGGENAGIWSFSRFTASQYELGSEIGADDRLDPAKSTAAAATFIDEEHRLWADWPLSVLAYRYGNVELRKVVKKLASKDPLRIQSALSKEHYFEQVQAVFILTKNLKAFGF